MRLAKILILAGALAVAVSCAEKKDAVRLTSYVDPFIGTASVGHTHPSATTPFGMIQAGPDNLCPNGNWNYCSGYNSESSFIIGFSHTHLSGTGASDMGDILFLPVTGEIPIATPAKDLTPSDDPLYHLRSVKEVAGYKGYGSHFSHDNEESAAGYYAVKLDDYGVGVQIAATPRTAYHRYTYPANDNSGVLIDLESGIGDNPTAAFIKVEDENTVVGMRRSTGFVKDHWYYFVAKFSKPIESMVSFADGATSDLKEINGTVVKALLKFKTEEGEKVDVKVALSTTGIEGARKNLDAENPGWDFDAVRKNADDLWESYLSRVEMKDNDIHKMRGFYTSLYHCLLMPNLVSDVDGRYEGWDHEIHESDGTPKYTNFSLWDTYRAEHPFLNLIYPEINSDLIKSLLEKYRQTGLLVTNEYGLCETWCMIGNHAVNPIVDAFLKGDTSFDPEFAYEAVKHSMTADHNKSDWSNYNKYGYFPFDISDVESQSRLMEACYDDYCVAKMAEKLGKKEDAEFFMKRSYNFRNLFDPETGFSRVKDTKGNFRPNFSPYDIDLPGFRMGVRDYTEGNAWQWTWHVQHDFDALVALFPSKEAFMEKFDQLFSNTGDLTGNESSPDVTGLIGMYAHGNEPSHHMAYFYTLAGQPAKTADIVRQIIDNFYPDTREGLCGNDDCGQMSAWYLFSTFGFYPIDPVSGEYVFGAPQAPWTKLSLPNGKSLEIKANGLSKTAKYVKSVTLNGKPLDLRTISYDQVMGGGVLEYEMTENK